MESVMPHFTIGEKIRRPRHGRAAPNAPIREGKQPSQEVGSRFIAILAHASGDSQKKL
jgi:hypothetical protein